MFRVTDTCSHCSCRANCAGCGTAGSDPKKRKITQVYHYKRTNKFAVKCDGKQVFQARPRHSLVPTDLLSGADSLMIVTHWTSSSQLSVNLLSCWRLVALTWT